VRGREKDRRLGTCGRQPGQGGSDLDSRVWLIGRVGDGKKI